MEKRYDLFELPAGGFPQWVDSASDLAEARAKMDALPAPGPSGQYLVRDFYSGSVVGYTLPVHSGTAVFVQSTDKPNTGIGVGGMKASGQIH